MAQKQVLGKMTDSGNTLTLEGNALRTETSIVALSNITQIKCVDDTPQYKLPWKLIALLIIAGLWLVGMGFNDSLIMILPGLACFVGAGFLVYNYYQKVNHKIYALVLEMSSGGYLAYHSDDLNFLNGVKEKVFEAVQNGSARVSYAIDMSQKIINEKGIVNTGRIGGDMGGIHSQN